MYGPTQTHTDFSLFPSLEELDLRNNSITGPLYSEIGDWPVISKLDMSLNKLSGAFYICIHVRVKGT